MTHKLTLTDTEGKVRELTCFGARDLQRQVKRATRAGLDVSIKRIHPTHRPPRKRRGYAEVRVIGGSNA